jgi:hypothetical protein
MGMNVSIEGSNPSFSVGGVAERSNAAVSKSDSGFRVLRGFKSLPLRFPQTRTAAPPRGSSFYEVRR